MFEPRYERCLEEQPHEQHVWKQWWFSRKLLCLGVSLDPWLKANLNIGSIALPTNLTLPKPKPEPHKCMLRFSGYADKIRNVNPATKRLLFQCRNCPDWTEVQIQRWKWNDMTRTMPEVDQTWPS